MIRVTVWNEFQHEKIDEKVKEIYPDGIHTTILSSFNNLEIAFMEENRNYFFRAAAARKLDEWGIIHNLHHYINKA